MAEFKPVRKKEDCAVVDMVEGIIASNIKIYYGDVPNYQNNWHKTECILS
jgi:hypothetical protein